MSIHVVLGRCALVVTAVEFARVAHEFELLLSVQQFVSMLLHVASLNSRDLVKSRLVKSATRPFRGHDGFAPLACP